MKLPAAGIEYVTYTITADFALDGTIAVYISESDAFPDEDATWTSASWSGAETIDDNGDHVRSFTVLLAGSEVTSVPAGAHQLTLGQNYVFVKTTDDPEIIIRKAGRVEAL